MNLLFISLGCDKNLVDTEKMLGILGKEGYSFVDDENEADIVVVNTCCFVMPFWITRMALGLIFALIPPPFVFADCAKEPAAMPQVTSTSGMIVVFSSTFTGSPTAVFDVMK